METESRTERKSKMETRFKMPTKILSFFLSALLALGSFSAALPGLLPSAFATTAQQWQALRDAFAAAKSQGLLATANATFTVSGNNLTYNDNSDGGYLYNVAGKIFEIAKMEAGTYNHNNKLRGRIIQQVGELNSYQKNFVYSCLPSTGNYSSHDDGHKYYRSKFFGNSTGNYEPQCYSNFTYTVTVSRTLHTAIKLEYPSSPPAANTNIKTAVKLSISCVAKQDQNHYSSSWESTWKDWKGSKHSEWHTDHTYETWDYYVNGALTSSQINSKTPDLSAITNYLNHVNAAPFQEKYNGYLNQGEPYLYAVPTREELYNIYNDYWEPKRVPLNSVDQFYKDLYIGQSVINKYDKYVNDCLVAYEVRTYEPYVRWINEGAHVDGFIDRDDYDPTPRVPANRERMAALRTQATTMRNTVEGVLPATKTKLAEMYQYDVARFDNYIEQLNDYIEIYDLTDIHDEIKFRMEKDETECFNGQADLWGGKNYSKIPYEDAGTECPIDDDMLQQLYNWLNAKYVSVINLHNFEQGNVDQVFQDPTISQIADFLAALQDEINYREIQETFIQDYYGYFEGVRYVDYSRKANDVIMSRIDEAEAKLAELINFRAQAQRQPPDGIGPEKALRIFGDYPEEMRAFIDTLYDELYNRCYQQHFDLLFAADDIDNGVFDGREADEVNMGNFSLIKRAISILESDEGTALYNWVKSHPHGHDVNLITHWRSFIPKYKLEIQKVMAKKWYPWNQVQLDDAPGSGHYLTRLTRDNDMVRDLEDRPDENYEVNTDKILKVIKKLDKFLTSSDFAKLIGVYREEEEENPNNPGHYLPAAHNLSEFIEALLLKELFNDKMVNTLIAMLFPMISKLLTDDLLVMLREMGDFMINPPLAGADASISLPAMMPNWMESGGWKFRLEQGILNAYLNGKHGTIRLVNAFNNIGLKVFPFALAQALPGQYSANKSVLNAAGESWSYFDADSDGKITPEELSSLHWGVESFESFTNVLGHIFGAVRPVLNCLFAGSDYNTGTITNLIYAEAFNADIHFGYKKITTHGTINKLTAYGSGNVEIAGLQAYRDLWAPIFEAFDIKETINSYDVTPDNPLSSRIGASNGTNPSGPQLVKALFMPLYALVKKLANKPLDYLFSVLPNITQYLTFDCISPLLQQLKLKLHVNASLTINSIDTLKVKILGIWWNVTWIANLLVDTLNGMLDGIVNQNIDLDLSDKINLTELVGCDVTDINEILALILSKIQEDSVGEARAVPFPAINAGKLARLGKLTRPPSIRTQNFSATDASGHLLPGGTRYFVEADKADVLYDILQWLLKFISVEGNLSGLLVTLGQKPLDPAVDSLLRGIAPEDALAALVELFVPQPYNFAPYKCYKASVDGHFNLDASQFVYIKYANNWTREKADFFHKNLDQVVNTIINMASPETLEGYGGINELLRAKINGMFKNKGIMNVLKALTKLGQSMAKKPEIAKIISDQLRAGGGEEIDLLKWYNTFGYLTYDYSETDPETGLLPEWAPKKPDDPEYINEFPTLSVQENPTGELDPDGNPILDEDGNPVKAYIWSLNGAQLIDGAENARAMFVKIFCEMASPISPLLEFLLTGETLEIFNQAIEIKGYDCYRSAVIPLFELVGVNNDAIMTQAQYKNYCDTYGAEKGFNHLVDQLFDRVDEILDIEIIDAGTEDEREYGPIQKIIELLPNIFYFLQAGRLSPLIKNLLQPLWVLIDTLRPIADLDLDAILHKLLCKQMKLTYDINDTAHYPSSPVIELLAESMDLNPEYDEDKASEDKDMVDGIFALSVEDLSLEDIANVVQMMFGLDLTPLKYALEGMCVRYEVNGQVYGVKEYDSKANYDARGVRDNPPLLTCRLEYSGADTITVMISALLDLLRYNGNAAALDALLAKEGSETSIESLIDAIFTVFSDKVEDMGERPNWDYLVEGRKVPPSGDIWPEDDADFGMLLGWDDDVYGDISRYHSIYNLKYVTDWTEDTAEATEEMLVGVLDYIAPMLDPETLTFHEFVDKLLSEKVFDGQLFRSIADMLSKIFNTVPDDVIGLVDQLLDIDMLAWKIYVSEQDVEHVDEEGNVSVVREYAADPDYKWWALEPTLDSEGAPVFDETGAAVTHPKYPEYIDTQDEFIAAIQEMLIPAAKLLGLVFLGEDYRFFYTFGEGPGNENPPKPKYGDDALVINGFNAYGKGIIPIFEALGVSLTGKEPWAYETGVASGATSYDDERFVRELVETLAGLLTSIINDPVSWLLDILPNLIYFLNADGLSVSINNILGSVRQLIETINVVLGPEKAINIDELIPGFDLDNLDLGSLFVLIESLTSKDNEAGTGIHINSSIQLYLESLYVGEFEAYTSANGNTAFRMFYSDIEERHDMITILLALLLEIIEDKGEYADENGVMVSYNNALALDRLINKGDDTKPNMVNSIVEAVRNPESVIYKDINWNYFDESFDLSNAAVNPDSSLIVPGYMFQYLNYTTDWTYPKAIKLSGGFEDLLIQVLEMTGMQVKELDEDGNEALDEDGEPIYKTVSEILKEKIGFDTMYSGKALQKALDMITPLLFGPNAALEDTLINVLGCILGADLREWDYKYAFEERIAGETYVEDAELGLDYRMAPLMKPALDAEGNPLLDENGDPVLEDTGELIKTYAVNTDEEFVKGATYMLRPAYRLLEWLLFGADYEFFNAECDIDPETGEAKHDVLVTLAGSDGYKEGLALLLEALGCTGIQRASNYTIITTGPDGLPKETHDMDRFISDLARSLCGRINKIFDQPVTEIINLIPELIYFINAGGLQVSLMNLLAGPMALVNKVIAITGDEELNIDMLIEDLLKKSLKNNTVTFSLDKINLEYLIDLAEKLTCETDADGNVTKQGLELTDLVLPRVDEDPGDAGTYGLEYFYMGQIVRYASASEKAAYKMRFSNEEDFADFITILLSFVIDALLLDGNTEVIAKLANIDPALLQAAVNFIKSEQTIDVRDIDWLYFDDAHQNDIASLAPGSAVDMPNRTINYLTYISDWTEESADFVFQRRNDIISAALSMSGLGDTTLAQLLNDSFSLERDLYTAENLNKILDAVKSLTGGLNNALLNLLDIILDLDLSAYESMPAFTEDEIRDRGTFVAGLYRVIEPIFSLLDWLLFGDDMKYFDRENAPVGGDDPDIEVLINIKGAEGYAYGLVPLLEALGVQNLPSSVTFNKTEDVFFVLVNNVLARLEAILNNPVDEALALLPNLLYFINANGVSASVFNLLGGALNLLEGINPGLPPESQVDIQTLISEALGGADVLDIENIDLLALINLIEHFTGLEITDFLDDPTNQNLKIENFFLGQIECFRSANGKSAFRMKYSEKESGAEMLTIILNLIVEALLYKDEANGIDNAAALEALLGAEPGTIRHIIDVIPTLGTEPDFDSYDWNYFGGTVDPVSSAITLPKTPFLNYLTYKTDWTQEAANYLYDNLNEIIEAVLRMSGADEAADTVAEILANSFKLYQAQYLNKILDLVAQLYDAVDRRLVDVLGAILGLNVSLWDGLRFEDNEITDADTFRAGLIQVLKPVYKLLDWLLFGDSFEFFVKDVDGTTILLKIAGNKYGYSQGLVPLLEALGVELPAIKPAPSCSNMLDDILKAVFARVDEILADPVDEALELIPNLFYFINANGVSTAVHNLAGSVLNALNTLSDAGFVSVDINELLGIDISKLDLEAIFSLLETHVDAISGLKINEAFKGTYEVHDDDTVTFVHDINGENIIEKFYIGKIDSFISTNDSLAYRMSAADGRQGDLITFLLSFALEIAMYDGNPAVLDNILNLPAGTVAAIVALLSTEMSVTLRDIDWVYFLGLEGQERDDAIANALALHTNDLPALPERTLHYVEYDNNWNEETASYLAENLPDIVDLVIAMMELAPDLDTFINEKLNLYSDATVNKIVEKIAKMLNKVDEALLDTIGAVLDVDVSGIVNYVSSGVHDKESFVAATSELFGKLGRILDWLLFGRDITLLTKLENGEPATIYLNGNDGYKNGLAPLLEAIGVDTHIGALPAPTADESITEQVIGDILGRVFDRVDEILSDPIPGAIDLLLELIYFLNADGVSVCAMNLVSPIDQLLEKLAEIMGKESLKFSSLIKFDLSNINLEMLSGLLKDKTGVDLWPAAGHYLSTFYFGELKYYESYEGVGGFRMVYTPEEDRHDMITILLTLVLDVFVHEGNMDALVKLFGGGEKGENIYAVIMKFLKNEEFEIEMQPYRWILTEHADTGEALSPIILGSIYDYIYGPLYTRAMGEYITKWLPSFINVMIVLLGIKAPGGGVYGNLEDLLRGLLGSSIYTNKNLVALYNAIKGLIDKIKAAVGADLFRHIAAILDNSLGVNLAYWDSGYALATITDGNREEFVQQVATMLRPVYPLLEWLLTSKDIAFFNKNENPAEENSYIIIHGAEGYAYSIIPILEAFHCDGTLTPEEYKAAVAADPTKEAMLLNIVNPLLDKLDEIFEDPVNTITGLLPAIIYFINSHGLDAAIKNLINAVLRVLKTIEPLTGEIDLYEAIGFNFDIDFNGLMDLALDKIENNSGFRLKEVAMEAITELTVGEVYSFTSKNSDPDFNPCYSMKYTTGADKVDLVTILLRLLLTFISVPENVKALKVILADKLTGDGYKFICALLENFSKMASTHRGMDEILYTVYWIFYSANVAAHETENGIAELNGNYSFLNQLFATSDLAFIKQIEKSFGDLLNKYTPTIIDDDEVAPKGFMGFFAGIKDFFMRIIAFFKRLFRIK